MASCIWKVFWKFQKSKTILMTIIQANCGYPEGHSFKNWPHVYSPKIGPLTETSWNTKNRAEVSLVYASVRFTKFL